MNQKNKHFKGFKLKTCVSCLFLAFLNVYALMDKCNIHKCNFKLISISANFHLQKSNR